MMREPAPPRDRGISHAVVHPRLRPRASPLVALIVVCFAMLMNTLDQTIVNVALPTIQRDLHFTQASLAWVIDAYLITFAGALLLAGRLGDLIGRKKVFLVGVALFTLASAACGAADTQALLIGPDSLRVWGPLCLRRSSWPSSSPTSPSPRSGPRR